MEQEELKVRLKKFAYYLEEKIREYDKAAIRLEQDLTNLNHDTLCYKFANTSFSLMSHQREEYKETLEKLYEFCPELKQHK